MKTGVIGILGGMGPEATVDLFREITRLTPARRDQDHVKVLIYSNPQVPDRTEAILGNGEDPVPELVSSARRLEAGGAGVIIIACNSAHYFLRAIRESVGVPVLSIIDEAYRAFRQLVPPGDAAGLLASTGTTRSGIYKDVFEPRGVRLLIPDNGTQAEVHAGILQVKAGAHDARTRAMFESAGRKLMEAGACAVILGCTEIPLAYDAAVAGYPSINATQALAGAAVRWALGDER